MSETSNRLPAGWYTDPAKTGGKRWWDGAKWTEHMKMPEVIAPRSAPALNDPYGLGQVRHTGPIAIDVQPVTASQAPTGGIDNRTAWVSLLFGLIAFGLTLVPSLPGSTLWWVSGAAIVALVAGVVAIAGRVAGTATNVISPVLGVLFGGAATVMVVMGIGIVGLVSSALVPAPVPSPAAIAPASSTEPLVFPTNQTLTGSGQVVQTIATAMNRTYAGGNATLSAGQSWPASVQFTSTQVVASDGTVLGTIPAGHILGYKRAADGKSYQITVAATNPSEVAVYDSSSNRFSFRCLPTDTSCVPTP